MAKGGRRVLIIVENLPVPFDRRVWLEARALTSAGYKVRVICPKMKGFTRTRESLEGIEIYRHPLPYEAVSGAAGFALEYATALLFEFVFALWIFLRHGFDAIHACNPPDTIFLIGRFFKLFGVRFLFDQHDINPELYLAKYQRKDFFYRLLCKLEGMTFATADVVISTNKSYQNIAITRGGMRPEDVFIVRSAPESSRFKAVQSQSELKQGRRYLVAYLGVMGRQEGLDLLLEAIRSIVQEHGRTDISFVLVGSGPELPHLQALCRKMGLANYVMFTGRIPDEELLAWLSTADVCVNPDRVNEMNDKSTMNKIMEYMAVGKPVVQFDMTEGRYSAGEASLYAAPNDPADFARCVLQLLDDEALRLRMGQAGLKRFREVLDWKYSALELTRAYERLFAAR